jgi:hypothetical protein
MGRVIPERRGLIEEATQSIREFDELRCQIAEMRGLITEEVARLVRELDMFAAQLSRPSGNEPRSS